MEQLDSANVGFADCRPWCVCMCVRVCVCVWPVSVLEKEAERLWGM